MAKVICDEMGIPIETISDGCDWKKERVSNRPRLAQRLIEAEAILSDLSTSYWASVLDDADASVNVKMGQRVLNYWKKRLA